MQRRQQLMVDRSGKDLHHPVQGLRRGEAQAVYEAAGGAGLFQVLAQLLASAVYDQHLVVGPGQPCDARGNLLPLGSLFQKRPSDFDNQLHWKLSGAVVRDQGSPAVSSRPNMTFRFCTACPAAPFTRLSMQLTTTNRRPSGPSVQWMSQKFEPLTSRS